MYVDVDNMKHLDSGDGTKYRVAEIILPQKAYKGGGGFFEMLTLAPKHIKV